MLEGVVFLHQIMLSSNDDHVPEFSTVASVAIFYSSFGGEDVHVVRVTEDVTITFCSFLSNIDLVHDLFRFWVITRHKAFKFLFSNNLKYGSVTKINIFD